MCAQYSHSISINLALAGMTNSSVLMLLLALFSSLQVNDRKLVLAAKCYAIQVDSRPVC